MKLIRIDISPMVSTLHREWDGEEGKTFTNFLRRKENTSRIIDKLNDLMNTENIVEIKLDLKNRSVKVEFNNFITLDELYKIINKLTINDLIAYKL